MRTLEAIATGIFLLQTIFRHCANQNETVIYFNQIMLKQVVII